MRLSAALLLVVLLTATTAHAAPTDEKSCKAAHGVWAYDAVTQAQSCITVAKDAGKICVKASDCQNVCLAMVAGKPGRCSGIATIPYGAHYYDGNGAVAMQPIPQAPVLPDQAPTN